MASVRHKRYAEPSAASDGTRILITRYRPRGIRKGDERWHAWDKRLAPSVALLDAAFGKRREGRRIVARDAAPIDWDTFATRYRQEMQAPDAQAALSELAARARAGETITLLCYCEDASRCHRTLALALLERAAQR